MDLLKNLNSVGMSIQSQLPKVVLVVKNPSANAGDIGDMGSVSESGISPGVGNGNLLQYSFLENSMDRGAWWARVQTVAKGQTLTEHAHTHTTSNGFEV